MTINNEDAHYGDGIDAMRARIEELEALPHPHVFITVNGGIAEHVTHGEVTVTFIDWDNYDDGGVLDFTLEDLHNHLDELKALPTEGEIGKWRSSALDDLTAIIDRETNERAAADAKAVADDAANENRDVLFDVLKQAVEDHAQKAGTHPYERLEVIPGEGSFQYVDADGRVFDLNITLDPK